MNTKFLTVSLYFTMFAIPASAHTGDHSTVTNAGVLEHVMQSPFHILTVMLLAIAAGALVWRIRGRAKSRARTLKNVSD